jgi:SAM-dependent methyltransferase
VNDETEPPEHVRRNRDHWDVRAAEYVGPGERAWARAEPTWGIWRVPESELHVLPEDVAGKNVIELGCGTAYISAWLARLGARVVGIDTSTAQLATARRLQREHGLALTLIHGNAEQVPYPDASFDLAISEYGACLWADPYRWVPEAARILRPGGTLIFLTRLSSRSACRRKAASPRATGCCGRRSGCIGWSGQARLAWSSTCPTATGSECSGAAGSRLRI